MLTARNPEGFLLDLHAWNITIAKEIAIEESIELSAEHIKILEILREFYLEYKLHPGMRVLIKLLQQKMQLSNIDSIYIHVRFPQGIKQISKIAGLPKPINCI